MQMLTITDPAMPEPIECVVRSVKAVEEFRNVTLIGRGGRMVERVEKKRWLEIVHEDGEAERFRLWPAVRFEVATVGSGSTPAVGAIEEGF